MHDYLPIPLPDNEPYCEYFLISDLCIVSMSILYMLHIYWTFFLVKSLLRKIMTGETEDTRSDQDERKPILWKED